MCIRDRSEGVPTDWWYYEDLKRPLLRVDSAVGVPRDEVTMRGITYEEMRPGSYEVGPRLEDMDVNHIEASLCFPTFPRFCGQTFTEAKDKELVPTNMTARYYTRPDGSIDEEAKAAVLA